LGGPCLIEARPAAEGKRGRSPASPSAGAVIEKKNRSNQDQTQRLQGHGAQLVWITFARACLLYDGLG
jgi:hypothetical protein